MWHRLRVWLRAFARPHATQRDIEKMGQAIAQEIAKYARERGVAPAKPS